MYSPWWVPVTVFLPTTLVPLRDHILDRNVKVGEGPIEPPEHLL